jgi:hypothetical protein
MLPLSVALPLTVKLPWISTKPGLTVIIVAPLTAVTTLPLVAEIPTELLQFKSQSNYN